MKGLLGCVLSVCVAVPCWAGASTDYNGTTTIYSCGSDPSLDNLKAGGGLSIVLWFNSDDSGENTAARLVQKAVGTTPTDGWIYRIDETSNFLRFLHEGGGGGGSLERNTSTSAYSDNVWVAAALTWDGSTTATNIRHYVDLVETTYGTTSNGGTLDDDSGSSCFLGNDSSSARTFGGQLAHVQLFNRVLSLAEIGQATYRPGSIANGLVLYQSMMDQSGVDLSPQQVNDCTPANGTDSASGPAIYLSSPLVRHWRDFWQHVMTWFNPVAWADDIVVCDSTDATVPNRVTSYQRSTDPFKSGATTNPNALIWSSPVSPIRPWDGIAPAGSSAYWKCVDTNADTILDDVVAMSQAEIDAVDAPAVADAVLQQSYLDEIAANTLCTATLTELDARIDALLDSAANLTQIKASTKTALKRLARCLRSRAQ